MEMIVKMTQRKIAEAINVRINVGNYQHIEIVKYAEEIIEYSSAEERVIKENALRDDLVLSLQRSMSAIPARLGKGVAEAQIVEESIKTKLPEWLASGAVPNIAASNIATPNLNIANMAAKKEIQVAAEQRNAVDKDRLLNKTVDDEGITNVKAVAPTIKPTEIVTSKTTAASPFAPSTPVKPSVSVQPELPIQPVAQPAIQPAVQPAVQSAVQSAVKKDVAKSVNSDDLFDDEEVVTQKVAPVAPVV